MIQFKEKTNGVVVGKIYQTTNYDAFKTITGNRLVSPVHKHRLKKSMANRYLLAPIAVNDKGEVIDGKHREEAAKELGLPINYYIVEGYGVEEIQTMNSNMRNWSKSDYLQSYCEMEHPEYIKFRQFMVDFPDFTFAPAEAILTNKLGTHATASTKELISPTNKKGSYMEKPFEHGELIIPNIKGSYINAQKIMMIKPFFPEFKEGVFVRTMLGMFRNKAYNHSVFLQKLSQQPGMLQKQRNIEQYRLHIEDIYNYRNRNKVSLRY